VDISKKVPDLNCEVQDLLLEVGLVDIKQEVPDLRSGGTPSPDLTAVNRLFECQSSISD